MCGFAAVFDHDQPVDLTLLRQMERDLLHRGPDGGTSVAEGGVGLCFRRLAIIDPSSASDQPMSDADGRYTLVFNGEIYNYKTLRHELQRAGVTFRTQGDSEVILHGYRLWGEAIFRRLEGMFALVIIDRAERKAIAARDPFGIKPLYKAKVGRQIVLASEIRPILRITVPEPDTEALGELLTFRFAAGRRSNLKGIELVPGGHLLAISLTDGKIEERQFCDVLSTFQPDETITESDALELAESAILDSVHQHLQSDVGYSLQLSGGVDSSLISAMAALASSKRLTSFGIQLEEKMHDEGAWRRKLVERYDLEHYEVLLTGAAFADAFPYAVRSMEGPVPHFGCVMLMLLCRAIAPQSKVVLTGEGADEMFGGYQRYAVWPQLRRLQTLAQLTPKHMLPFVRRRYDGIARLHGRSAAVYSSVYHDIDAMAALFPGLIRNRTVRNEAADRFGDFRTQMFAADQTSYLASLLMRQDKMAMSASVEARVPFTHWPLAQLVNRFPNKLRAPGGETKPLLKKIAEKYLPHDLIYRRKIGLTLPLDQWLRDPNGLGRYVDYLLSDNCQLMKFAEPKALRKTVADFREGRHGVGQPSMAILVNVELWLRSLSSIPA